MASTHFFINTHNTLYKVLIITVFLALLITFPVFTQDITDVPVWTPQHNSGFVRDYNTIIQKIYAISDDNIEIIRVGSVLYDTVSYPVFALSYTPLLNPVTRVFLSGGQHGNEPAPADAIIDFFEYISANKALYNDIAVDAIPMINPYGWVKNTRFNGDGRDTNRDYKRFRTQEARIVRDFVQGKSYGYMIDLHESPADGAFMFNYNEDMFEICNNLMDYLRSEGYGIGVKGYFKDRRLINGIMDIPSRRKTYTSGYIKSRENYWHENMIIVRYFNSEFDAYGFTMETSTKKLYKYRVECHFDVIRFMINAFRDRYYQ